MGANMQFNSYFPGYYNLSLDGNGNSWPLNRDNKVSENGNLYNTTFLSPDYLLSYNKELLKQTMLKHETIFKDQIQELHRLYKRQKELTEETRRNEFNSYLKKSEASNSNMAFFQVATEYVQKNFQVPAMMTMTNPSSGQIPEKRGRSRDVQSLESNCKKVGNKILDLQLPADEYIDCDDDEKVAQRPEALSYSVNGASQVLYTNVAKSFFGSNAMNPVYNGATENYLNLSAGSNGFLSPTGQNTKSSVQYLLEESVKNAQKKPFLEASTSFLSYPDKTGIYGSKLNSFVQGFNAEKLPSVSKSLHKDLEQAFSPPVYSLESSRMKSGPLNNSNLSGQQEVVLHRNVFDDIGPRNPIAVQALPCFKRYKSSAERPEFGGERNLGLDNHGLKEHKASVNSKQPRCLSELSVSEHFQSTDRVEKTHNHPTTGLSWLRAKPVHVEPEKAEETCSSSKTCLSPFEDSKSKGKSAVLDLNMACDSVPESETELTSDEVVVENGKDKGFGCVIDLNSSLDEVDFLQKPSLTAEIDLDAPSSPENKECSPPRGESEGNQTETAIVLSGQEGTDPLEDEQARVAAEAMISFAKESSKESLEWFAGIVASVASNSPAAEFEPAGSDDEIDFFEAMTLNLEETKADEFCNKVNFLKEEETTGTSSSPGQQKKGGGRARRGRPQRKDFQREILPSLASLSRYEVTEDLQTIGGLMEAAGAPWEATGSARNGRVRRRGSTAVVGCSAESLLKKLSGGGGGGGGGGEGKMGKEERSVICWGKVTRRRRGQRCPVRVSNHQQLILSQV